MSEVIGLKGRRRRDAPPERRKATYRIERDLWDALDAYAEEEGISQNEALNELLDVGLAYARDVEADLEAEDDVEQDG